MFNKALFLFAAIASAGFAQTGTLLQPDPRYKADLLLVVAHPDDETILSSYLARIIFDEHKRVAVIFGTRGNTGGNAHGDQQAASLGLIREIEGRRALATLGVSNVWFLSSGFDTPGENVLHSLETWNHGSCLDQVVRIIRLTQPEVIVSWLPDFTAGENHGDHQAASVLATEAFDLAGDDAAFPEQITPPSYAGGISNLTEGLQPWQPQKLYFVTDADDKSFAKGKGPEYSALDVSPSKHVTYAQLAAVETAPHLTQGDSGLAVARALENGAVNKTYVADPVRFIFGKSLTQGSVTGDIFEGVVDRIPFHRVVPQPDPPAGPPHLELWGPFFFYRHFWREHNLDHLADLVPNEIVGAENQRWLIPLRIANSGNSELRGEIKAHVPAGWTIAEGPGAFTIPAGAVWSSHVVVVPGKPNSEWQKVTVSAGDLGEVEFRAKVDRFALPQQ